MTRLMLRLSMGALLLVGTGVGTPAQATQDPYVLSADHVVPGRPWTNFIPDPDKFDWNAPGGGRPGYRYRGMLPMHQRFYDYIQQKRRANVPLSAADESTMRWLISSRRWPEAPRPNAFWAAFMRYLREQQTLDLNIAQTIMLDQLRSRGLVATDPPPSVNAERINTYLNSGPFQPRNWFERTFGRVEPWMDNLYAGWGYDMRPAASGGANTFPGNEHFNGLKINYNVTGATLGTPVDGGSFTITRHIEGVLGTGTLAISGTFRVGGFGADVTLSVWAGDKKEDKSFYVENTGSNGNPQNFSLSVPIPAGARSGGFAIRLDGRYSMGGGHRGCYVTGDFGPSKEQLAAEQAAGDAKWRQEVEDTLKRLGYENTPEGKELEAMRQALAGGDAAWNAFVNSRLDQMSGDNSPQVLAYRELETAMLTGGAVWDQYVATHGGGPSKAPATTPPPVPPVAPPAPPAPPATPVAPPPAGTPIELFSSGNIYGVASGPTAPTTFTLSQPHVIASISTYHWNDGRGTGIGTIALRAANGQTYGPWTATGIPGQGGVPNANWMVAPNITLPAGTYQIIDSEPSTWSQNPQSRGRGMATVKGYPIR